MFAIKESSRFGHKEASVSSDANGHIRLINGRAEVPPKKAPGFMFCQAVATVTLLSTEGPNKDLNFGYNPGGWTVFLKAPLRALN